MANVTNYFSSTPTLGEYLSGVGKILAGDLTLVEALNEHESDFDEQFRQPATSTPSYHTLGTQDLVQHLTNALADTPVVGPALSTAFNVTAPAAFGPLSLMYDTISAARRTNFEDPGSFLDDPASYVGTSLSNLGSFGAAIDDEDPLSAMYHRMVGASGPLYNQLDEAGIINAFANPFAFMGTAQANPQVDTTSNYQDRIQQVAATQAAAAAAAAEEAATIRELAMSGQGGPDNRPVSSQTSSPLGGMLGASLHGGGRDPRQEGPRGPRNPSQGGNPHL